MNPKVHEIVYSCDSREELAERIVKLEELCEDLIRLPSVPAFDCYGCRYDEHTDCEHGNECTLLRRASELGIEVDE